jgi:hypothetical protein
VPPNSLPNVASVKSLGGAEITSGPPGLASSTSDGPSLPSMHLAGLFVPARCLCNQSSKASKVSCRFHHLAAILLLLFFPSIHGCPVFRMVLRHTDLQRHIEKSLPTLDPRRFSAHGAGTAGDAKSIPGRRLREAPRESASEISPIHASLGVVSHGSKVELRNV